MTDPIRKTVVERPTADGVRTTVIGQSSDAVPPSDNPRQTVLEQNTTVPVDNRRATIVESAAQKSADCSEQPPPQMFRSLVRPPMALVTAFDDGSTDVGETWRLRRSRTTIGRTNSNIEIAHDPDVSAEHAEIVRREQDGGHQWQLVDLNSTNGTFVRVNRMILRNGRELLLGGRRFIFKCQDTIGVSEAHDSEQAQATQKQGLPRPGQILKLGARLVEQTPERGGGEHILAEARAKTLLGRDASQCDIHIPDPYLDNIHAQLFQDKQSRWVIKDQQSLNGVWVRVPNKLLDPGTEFLLGGQRFRFDPL
jgi:pSer/pThr/pTyr-binding forkhead associated (FHA) protein